MSNDQLYLIAIIPPNGIYEDAMEFKNDLATRFNCPYTLKVIPHITLIDVVIKLPQDEHSKLVDWFKSLHINQKFFKLKLDGFKSFNGPHPVIYINPLANSELHTLQHNIAWSFNISFPGMLSNKKFTPHMTVAYRDLTPDMYQVAWKEYETKKYSAEFEINTFQLLQYYSNKWNIIETYDLRKA
jgi:2'-5' RNA ligase